MKTRSAGIGGQRGEVLKHNTILRLTPYTDWPPCPMQGWLCPPTPIPSGVWAIGNAGTPSDTPPTWMGTKGGSPIELCPGVPGPLCCFQPQTRVTLAETASMRLRPGRGGRPKTELLTSGDPMVQWPRLWDPFSRWAPRGTSKGVKACRCHTGAIPAQPVVAGAG